MQSTGDVTALQILPSGPIVRNGEPVTCGIPLPRGLVHDARRLRVFDAMGRRSPLQARSLDAWPDGSLRWVLLDWQAATAGPTAYRLRLEAADLHPPDGEPTRQIVVHQRPGELVVDTQQALFVLSEGMPFFFRSVTVNGRTALDARRSGLFTVDQETKACNVRIERMEIAEPGPLRAMVRATGTCATPEDRPFAELDAELHFFAGSATVRLSITIRNPRRAAHPGGIWVLGDAGSIYLRDLSLRLVLPGAGESPTLRCSPELGMPLEELATPFELYQDSSGGENWQSSNHVNRYGQVPHTFRGYHVRAGNAENSGLRAAPVVQLEREGHMIALAMEHFWQNFPKAIEADAGGLTLRLFPGRFADVHELQGGEQKTHEFYVAFGPDSVTDIPLAWCRQPLVAHANPEWYCSTSALPYLTPKTTDPHVDYLALVDSAIVGDHNFEHKREVIDEYGWRHFGDIYGDHEAVRKTTPPPLASHYNNQYDPIAGFAYQFLRSGDLRWWQQMRELARHVIDIDVYHTDQDKPAYNHGLFWHTIHYIDAGTSTHRSYPCAPNVAGGGPAGEHNYTTGLVLHHFLTGDRASRQTAVDLARWVVDMDDGSKTVFRWCDRGHTGLASSSDNRLYHGPGRGPANSLNALVDGHCLTGKSDFLGKAEQLVRRCIHPADDLASLELLDAERRWFYTMFLQSLGKYLDHKATLGQLDSMYAYARQSLLHYARWMAEHEYPYLDKPEILEFPTETWAAQDMRKSEVFKFAAKHVTGKEREQFLERADFFFRYSTTTLRSLPTHGLCRPTVLLLANGFMHAWFHRHPDTAAPLPSEPIRDFGRPVPFTPQKVRALRRLKLLLAATLALSAVAAYLVWSSLGGGTPG